MNDMITPFKTKHAFWRKQAAEWRANSFNVEQQGEAGYEDALELRFAADLADSEAEDAQGYIDCIMEEHPHEYAEDMKHVVNAEADNYIDEGLEDSNVSVTTKVRILNKRKKARDLLAQVEQMGERINEYDEADASNSEKRAAFEIVVKVLSLEVQSLEADKLQENAMANWVLSKKKYMSMGVL
jgi:hypothetical protein